MYQWNGELTPLQEENKRTTQKNFYPFQYDAIYEIRDGKEIDLTEQQSRAFHEFYEITTISPRYTFLGSVLNEQSINSTKYRPIGTFNDWKKEITISFSLPIRSKIIKPTKSDLQNAIEEAIHDKNFIGKQSQIISYKMKEFSYYNQLKYAFGANLNIGHFFNVNIEANGGKIQSNTGLFIDFSQTYFSVDMDFPEDGNIFINEATRQKFLSQSPIYIGTVNYGRKGVLLVESSYSYTELSTAIRAAFSAKIVNGKLSLDTNTKEILTNAHIQICIIGGDGTTATKTVEGFEAFQDYIIKGGVYSPQVYGVPISYTASYALDNSLFVSEFDI